MTRVKAKYNGTKKEDGLLVVQYIERTNPMDRIDKMMRCVCLRQSTPYRFDYSITKKEKDQLSKVSECLGVELFRFVARGASLVRENFLSKPFKNPRHQAQKRLYVNSFAPQFEEAL